MRAPRAKGCGGGGGGVYPFVTDVQFSIDSVIEQKKNYMKKVNSLLSPKVKGPTNQ